MTTTLRLPGVMTLPTRSTPGQRRAVATVRAALRQADTESGTVCLGTAAAAARLPSQQTQGRVVAASPAYKHRPVQLLPILDAQPPVVVTAGWPQWLGGLALLLMLFTGVAVTSLGSGGTGQRGVAGVGVVVPAATLPDLGTATATSSTVWPDGVIVP